MHKLQYWSVVSINYGWLDWIYIFLLACRGANNNSIDADECDTLENEVVWSIFIFFTNLKYLKFELLTKKNFNVWKSRFEDLNLTRKVRRRQELWEDSREQKDYFPIK